MSDLLNGIVPIEKSGKVIYIYVMGKYLIIGIDGRRYLYRVIDDDRYFIGWEGENPAQLGLAILLDFFKGDGEQAGKYLDDFRREFIATMPEQGRKIYDEEIETFLEKHGSNDEVFSG